jgi:hypothetical protein
LVNDISKNVEIREHFLGFCPVTDTTGEGLTTFLLDYLKELNIWTCEGRDMITAPI